MEVLDLSAFTVMSTRTLLNPTSPDARERSAGMGITHTDDLLAVPTRDGIELITVVP